MCGIFSGAADGIVKQNTILAFLFFVFLKVSEGNFKARFVRIRTLSTAGFSRKKLKTANFVI